MFFHRVARWSSLPAFRHGLHSHPRIIKPPPPSLLFTSHFRAVHTIPQPQPPQQQQQQQQEQQQQQQQQQQPPNSAADSTNPPRTTPASSAPLIPRIQSQPHYRLSFTCVPCDTRSTHRISKQGYHHGSVLITCPHCRNRHVISDHLGIFGDRKLTVEDLMRERGRIVKKGSLGEDGDIEFWSEESQALDPRQADLQAGLERGWSIGGKGAKEVDGVKDEKE